MIVKATAVGISNNTMGQWGEWSEDTRGTFQKSELASWIMVRPDILAMKNRLFPRGLPKNHLPCA